MKEWQIPTISIVQSMNNDIICTSDLTKTDVFSWFGELGEDFNL